MQTGFLILHPLSYVTSLRPQAIPTALEDVREEF